MYRTEDSYEFYFYREISQTGIKELDEFWRDFGLEEGYSISPLQDKFIEGETSVHCILNSTYGEFKKVLLPIYMAFGDYDASITIAGDSDDLTMEVSASLANGNIDYSLECYENYGEKSREEFCGERNLKFNGKVETNIEEFVRALSSESS